MAVAVHAAGHDQPAAGVDFLRALVEVLPKRRDAPSDDADIGPDHIGGRDDRAAANDRVVCRHLPSLSFSLHPE